MVYINKVLVDIIANNYYTFIEVAKMAFGYYEKKEQNIVLDGYTPISVIANLRTDGKFVPFKAQIFENDERINIDLFARRTVEQINMITFDCYYERENNKCPLTIYYFLKQHIWMIQTPRA